VYYAYIAVKEWRPQTRWNRLMKVIAELALAKARIR
jgi:hypothetical protein